MNKQINFEDTIYILNIRIRMIKDLLRLDIDTEHFYKQTMGDLEFINTILQIISEKFLANLQLLDRETEGDNLSDAEWQFSQLLNEFSANSGPFSVMNFPDSHLLIENLKKESLKRRKLLEESSVSKGEQSYIEPVVSTAELSGLLGN